MDPIVVKLDNDFECEDDPLECFIEKRSESPSSNPFYVAMDVVSNIVYVDTTRETLENIATLNSSYLPIKRVMVMCLKTNGKPCDSIYSQDITPIELTNICEQYCLIECSAKILKTKIHAKSMFIASKNILDKLQHFDTEIRDYEIVVPLFDFEYHRAIRYINMFKQIEYDYNALKEAIEFKKFLGSTYKITYEFVENILNDYFWKNKTDEFNMTRCINKRKLRKYEGMKEMDQIQTDYQFDAPQVKMCNAYTALKTAQKRTYYIKDPTYKNIGLSSTDVTQMFMSLNDNKSIYNMFNAFASSRQHCHLVVNNKDILRIMVPFFKRYPQTYINVLTYPMISMYAEECILTTKLTKDCRCIFTIDVAHELPVYPYNENDIHMSPYNVLSVPDAYYQTNLYGLSFIDGYKHYGIDNLEGFRRKFNLFTTRTETRNTFDGINWSSFAISGSVIPACVPKRSPLVDTVSVDTAPYDVQFNAYFDKFYGKSDIDVVCTEKTLQGFFDETYKLIVQVKKNLSLDENNNSIIITPVKMSRIFVHKDRLNEFLEELYVSHPEIKNIKNIDKHINENAVIQKFFYDKYVQYKTQKFKDVKITTPTQKLYVDLCSQEHFKVCVMTYDIIGNQGECIYVETKVDDKRHIEIATFKVEETIRFQVSDNPENTEKKLMRPFEVFRSRDGGEAFSTVARFHLPCVRGYYNGTNVHMTPSCVMSHLTYMNIDYNYFAGSQQPIEIILKYLGRGYGTYLNKNERNFTTSYCTTNQHFQNVVPTLYNQKRISNPIFGTVANVVQPNVNIGAVRTSTSRKVFDTDGNILPFKSWACEEVWQSVNFKK